MMMKVENGWKSKEDDPSRTRLKNFPHPPLVIQDRHQRLHQDGNSHQSLNKFIFQKEDHLTLKTSDVVPLTCKIIRKESQNRRQRHL